MLVFDGFQQGIGMLGDELRKIFFPDEDDVRVGLKQKFTADIPAAQGFTDICAACQLYDLLNVTVFWRGVAGSLSGT